MTAREALSPETVSTPVDARTGVGPAGAPATEVQVVPMRRRHLRGVLRIEAHNVHRPWSLGLFMGELRQPESRVYATALAGGTVVGFAGLMLTVDEAHVTTIATHPTWRRGGVATRLLVVLARRARAHGMRALTLEVAASNQPAQALYRRFGLAPVGVRKNYYEDLGEDAVIMWAHDIDGPAYGERLDRIEAGLPAPLVAPGWPS